MPRGCLCLSLAAISGKSQVIFSNKPLQGLALSCNVALALKGFSYEAETKMPHKKPAEKCAVHKFTAALAQTLAWASQTRAVSISMMHLGLAPLGHFIKQVLKTPGNCKPVEFSSLKRRVLILGVVQSLHALQWDSWGHEMAFINEQWAILLSLKGWSHSFPCA